MAEKSTTSSDAVRVLIVDDSEAFLRSARRHLSLESGIRVLGTARDGEQAVVLCRRLNPDVVLVDMSMPGRNGIETAAAIKRLQPAPRVVLLTGHDTDVYRRQAHEAGIDAILGKWSLSDDAPDLIRKLGSSAGSRQESP